MIGTVHAYETGNALYRFEVALQSLTERQTSVLESPYFHNFP